MKRNFTKEEIGKANGLTQKTFFNTVSHQEMQINHSEISHTLTRTAKIQNGDSVKG